MDYTFSQVSKENLPNLELFFKKVYPGTLEYGSKEQFEWKILNNPEHLGIINTALCDNQIASTTTLTPKSLYIKGELLSAAEIGDTYTDENHQRKGLFASLVNLTREGGIVNGQNFIYGTPNTNSLPGYLKKCDFIILPELTVFGHCCVLKLESPKNNSAIKLLINFLNKIVSIPMFIFFKLNANGIMLVEIDQFDSRFDLFWEKIKHEYDFIFNKNNSFLNWRFVKSPFTYKKYAIYKKTSLMGYVITREDSQNNTLYIADYLISKSNILLLKNAISKITGEALKNNVKKVYVWASSSDHALKAFSKNLFIKRSNVPIIAYKNNLTTKLESLKAVHFSMSDSDNI